MIKIRSRSIGSLPKIGISFRKRKKPVVSSRKTSLAPVDGQSVDENGRKELSHDLSSLNNFENVPEKRSDNNTDKDDR